MSSAILKVLTDTFFTGQFLMVVVFAVVAFTFFSNRFISPLRTIPNIFGMEFLPIMRAFMTIDGSTMTRMADWHYKYGPIVRIGPNKVSICDPSAIKTVYGSHKFRKGPRYDSFTFGGNNLLSIRDPAFHKIRKRALAPAYSQPGLDAIEPLISETGVTQLSKRLDETAKSGQTIDLLWLLQSMTFDVIGEIVFGKSFNMLQNGEHPIIKWIEDTTMHSSYNISFGIFSGPFKMKFAEGTNNLREFAKEALRARRESKTTRKDTLQWFMDAADMDTEGNFPEEDLLAETILQLIAGTDTTALTLMWTINLLLNNPDCMDRLVEELDQAIPSADETIQYKDVRNLPYLNAVLHESMRIQPIVNELSRLTPEGGAELCGHYIPAGTEIAVSILALHTREEFWPKPKEFIPDRWLTGSEQLAEMQKFFNPFSMGPRGCIGRLLAWMELKLTIATLFRRFKFQAMPNQDMRPVLRFVARPVGGKFVVTVQRRSPEAVN